MNGGIAASTMVGENYASTELLLGGWTLPSYEDEEASSQHLTPEGSLAMIDIATNQLLMQVSLKDARACVYV